MRHFISILVAVVVLSAAGFAMLGLQGRPSRKPPLELFSDMDRQPKLRPQKPFDFFSNGVSSQMAPAGARTPDRPFRCKPIIEVDHRTVGLRWSRRLR